MVRYLSEAWVDACQGALAAAGCAVDGGPVVVEHHVGDATYHVILGDGGSFRPGPSPTPPSVTLTVNPEDARAIAEGRTSARQAFLAGRLRVRGDLRALTAITGSVAALDEALAPVRAATEG